MTSLTSEQKDALIDELRRRCAWLLEHEGTTFVGAVEVAGRVEPKHHRNALLEAAYVDVFVSAYGDNKIRITLTSDRATIGITHEIINTDWSPDHIACLRSAIDEIAKKMVLDDLANA